MTQTATLRSIVIGSCNNDFTLMAPGISGLGIPDIKAGAETSRLGSHGLNSGADYLGMRTLGIPVGIKEIGNPRLAMQRLRTLKNAWRPAQQDEVLSLYLPGYGPADDIVRFYGRPRTAIDVDMSFQYGGIINALATFVALDPIGYGPIQTVSISNGMNTIMVTGDAPSSRATIQLTGQTGAASSTILTNHTDSGRKIIIKDAIPNGQVWTLDLHNQTLRTSTGVDKFSAIDPSSTWFKILGGSNVIQKSGLPTISLSVRGGWW